MINQTLFDSKWCPEPFSGCHLWTGANNPAGYGKFAINRKNHQAHRVSWQIHRGEIPQGMLVLHSCDTPGCVNPDHLFLGTHKDNERDKVAKNRNIKGEAHRLSKLKPQDIVAIRADERTGWEIAKDYGVCQALVSAIKHRRTWRHIA